MQQLATGSEWVDDDNTIIRDEAGYDIYASPPRKLVCVKWGDSVDTYEVYAQDLLAVIDRAGLDPVRVAARGLVQELDNQSYRNDNGNRVVEFDDVMDALRKLEALL
jgi:hypothetical protein